MNTKITPALIWRHADKPSPFGIGGMVSHAPYCSDCTSQMQHVGLFPKGKDVYQVFYCFTCQKDNVVSECVMDQTITNPISTNPIPATQHASVWLLSPSLHQKTIDELESQQLKVWETQQVWRQQQALQEQKERLLARQAFRDDPASQMGMDFEDEELLLPPVQQSFQAIFAQGNAPSNDTPGPYLLSEDTIPVHASFARPQSFSPPSDEEGNLFVALTPQSSVVSRKKVPYTHRAGEGVYTQGCGLLSPPSCPCCQQDMKLFLHVDSVSHECLSFPDMSSCCVYFCLKNPETFVLRCEK